MRKLVLIVIALAAAGGPAGARPRHKAAHAHAHAAPAAPASKPAALDAAPSEADRDPPGPMPAFGGLAALSETQARDRLGAPDIARSEGSGAMWTYRLPDCALFVFFRAAAGQLLGPRQLGLQLRHLRAQGRQFVGGRPGRRNARGWRPGCGRWLGRSHAVMLAGRGPL